MKADFVAADEYKRLVAARTGFKPDEIVCPREKSEMTPCVARDGRNAAADTVLDDDGGCCVGCSHQIYQLLAVERDRHPKPKPPEEARSLGEDAGQPSP